MTPRRSCWSIKQADHIQLPELYFQIKYKRGAELHFQNGSSDIRERLMKNAAWIVNLSHTRATEWSRRMDEVLTENLLTTTTTSRVTSQGTVCCYSALF